MSKLSLRARMALLFAIVVTAVLSLAAVSFDYFCRFISSARMLGFWQTRSRLLERSSAKERVSIKPRRQTSIA